MKTVNFTEFRKHASTLLSEVDQGGSLLVMRHGRPIAEILPAGKARRGSPSWKRPGLRLQTSGTGLAAAILQERRREDVP